MKKDKTTYSALRAIRLILDVAGESEEDEKKKHGALYAITCATSMIKTKSLTRLVSQFAKANIRSLSASGGL